MKSRLRRWLVFFFTRPIHLSDLRALASRMRPRDTPEPVAAAAATAIAHAAAAVAIDTVPLMPAPARPRKVATARAEAGPSTVSSMFHRELEIGVSEQPLDTLPADLRDELQRPSSGRLQGSGVREF